MPQTRVGEYRIRSGNSDLPFWRIAPGWSPFALVMNTAMGFVAPSTDESSNVLTMVPPLCVFDVIVRMSEPVVETQLTDGQSTDLLVDRITGVPTNGPMPMWDDGSGSAENRIARICFALPVPPGQHEVAATLELVVSNTAANAGNTRVRLPIKAAENDYVSNLAVHLIATPRRSRPGESYAWVQVPVEEWIPGAGPRAHLPGASVDAKIMRDNYRRGFRYRNRRLPLQSDNQGFAAFEHPSTARNTVAYPIDWPLIFTARAERFVNRALLVRLESGDVSDNLDPHRTTPISLISTVLARSHIANKSVLLDPGHAVVYGFSTARRSQEWFVAHKVGQRIRDLLHTRFGVPHRNLFMTRTAGFGLIDPGDIGSNSAPERGAANYVFDLPARRVRLRNNSRGMHHISDLLLTGDDDRPGNITESDRNRLVTTNTATIDAIVARTNGALPAGQRVHSGSVRWHAGRGRYVCTIERHPVPVGQRPIIDDDRLVTITTADWFTLDRGMLDTLARRTARWTTTRELGSGAGANAATGRPSFRDAVQQAMATQNAENYIATKIIEELSLEEPFAPGAAIPNTYRNKETMGWHYAVRRAYINRKNCDLSMTIHENATGPTVTNAVGMAMLVGRNPPAAHVRAAKVFMKYVDPFDQGLRAGGIAESGAGQLASSNLRRAKHVYFELEFMTSTIQDNPGVRGSDPARYQYQDMVAEDFVSMTTEQILAGVIEFLVDVQPDLDQVTYDLANLPNW